MSDSKADAPKIPCDVFITFTSDIGSAEFNRRFYLPAVPRPGESCTPVDGYPAMVLESVAHRFEVPNVVIRLRQSERPADETWKSLYIHLSETGWDLVDTTGAIIREFEL